MRTRGSDPDVDRRRPGGDHGRAARCHAHPDAGAQRYAGPDRDAQAGSDRQRRGAFTPKPKPTATRKRPTATPTAVPTLGPNTIAVVLQGQELLLTWQPGRPGNDDYYDVGLEFSRLPY